MATPKKSDRVEAFKTSEFRVSYPTVFAPREDEQGKKYYACTMLFKKSDPFVKELVKKVKDLAALHWGADYKGKLDMGIRDGNEKYNADPEKNFMYKDMIYITAKSSGNKNNPEPMKPIVVGRRREVLTSAADFYGGCYGLAWVNAYTFEGKNNGITFGLEGIQKTNDGEAFGAGGHIDPLKAFDDLGGDDLSGDETVDTSDPLGDLMG